MHRLYDAGWQATKVHLLIWGMIAFAGVMFSLALLQPAGPPPPEVESPLAGLLARLFAGVVGLAAPAAMLVYGRCYIAAVDDFNGDAVIEHIGLFGRSRRIIRPEDLRGTCFQDGQYQAGGLVVNAPWHTVRLHGLRLPLILDVQGKVLDRVRLSAALGIPVDQLWEEPAAGDLPGEPSRDPGRASLKARKRR